MGAQAGAAGEQAGGRAGGSRQVEAVSALAGAVGGSEREDKQQGPIWTVVVPRYRIPDPDGRNEAGGSEDKRSPKREGDQRRTDEQRGKP